MQRDADDQRRAAEDFERKAMLLLTRAQNGELDTGKAESLAAEALNKQKEYTERCATLEKTV